MAYGEPELNSLRVVERERGHVVLELLTGGFYALRDSEERVWLWTLASRTRRWRARPRFR